MSAKLALSLILALAFGCARSSATFTPAKAEYRDGASREVSDAYVGYEGDLQALLEAGGIVLGHMEGSGNAFADHGDVEEHVRRRAADWGATHIVLISASDEEDRTPVEYRTQCDVSSPSRYAASADCTTTSSGGIRFYRPRAGYTLIRVPARHMAELPRALGGKGQRPAPVAPVARVAASPAPPAPGDAERSPAVRARCEMQARKLFGTDWNVEAVSDSKESTAATGWATRYADGKRVAAPQQQPTLAEDERRQQQALGWYRNCLDRGGRTLAEAPAPSAQASQDR